MYYESMRILNNNILTKREAEIILQILSGKNKQEIAKALSLSVSTIKTNVEKIYQKFNVHSKTEMIIYIIKNKIVDLEDNKE